MRKTLSSLLAAAFLVTLIPLQGPAVAQGVPPPITRAGAVALLVQADPALKMRAEWYDRHMPPISLFYDVDQGLWYAPYIEAAFEAGIVTGTDENREFRPGDLLKSEEAIAFVNRAKAHRDPAAAAGIVAGLQGNWVDQTIATARAYGVALPAQIRLGEPVTRDELHAMYGSIGLPNTAQIALTIRVTPPPVVAVVPPPPAVTPPAARPVTPPAARPVVPPARPVTPPPSTPPSTGTRPQYASSKFFSVTIPAAGIKDLTITHPANATTSQGLLAPLQAGVGHLFSYPGKGGKILVYGHSSSYPWDVSGFTKIFRQINTLNAGDKIYVTYNGKMYVYQVTHETVVPATDTSAYRGGGGEELILYTCWPPDDIKQRYLVHAKPVETVALN